MDAARVKTVPEVGVEPTHPKVHEFESCASANSATPALAGAVYAWEAALSMAKANRRGLGGDCS